LQSGAEGIGPPLHSHPWDEAYFVIEGVLRVKIGDKSHDLAAGSFAHIPAGSYHDYAAVGGPARFVSITSRAGAARFFADIDREVPTLPPDFPKLLAVAERHRVRVQPPA
jgi:mannose-6-phosphate isomerase-like protein (cupin superfamily)